MKQVRVYILDDDKDAVERVELLLKESGMVKITGTETDPRQAIHQIRSNRPELIFLDIEMPGMCGFDLLDQIREDDYSPSVIFITAYDNYAIQAIKESALDYLLKPVDGQELKQAVEKYYKGLEKHNDKSVEILQKLSAREQEVFRLLQAGNTSMQISNILNISKNTVDTHRRKILSKLGFDSTTQIHLNYPLK